MLVDNFLSLSPSHMLRVLLSKMSAVDMFSTAKITFKSHSKLSVECFRIIHKEHVHETGKKISHRSVESMF